MKRTLDKKLINPLVYTPYWRTKSKIRDNWKKYRNACSLFSNRKEVREFIFKRNNYKCVICGASENLQIDHIISAERGFKEKINITKINNISNLQTLCRSCNISKGG